jgi:hypothetical protein
VGVCLVYNDKQSACNAVVAISGLQALLHENWLGSGVRAPSQPTPRQAA